MSPDASRADLVVLSNRGPVSFVRDQHGHLQARRGAGGLVVTLGPGAERDQALWISSATSDEDLEAAKAGEVRSGGIRYQAVPIDGTDYNAYYNVVANQTIWFCLHGLFDSPRRPRFDRHWWGAWERYVAVNESFAEAVCRAAAPGATVLVQDYHLALVPALLARQRADLKTTCFLHTPFCTPEELSMLPEKVGLALVSGLAGGGSVGFHTQRWALAFQACAKELTGHAPTTYVNPAATDVNELLSVARSEDCLGSQRRLAERVGRRRLIVRVDRIELSKNVLRGFWAFDELLETRPDLRGEVVFAAMVYPSRLGIPEYQAYGQEVSSLAALINSKWAHGDWEPILLDPEDDYPRSVAALCSYDVLLVNPVRDGLNLVAKEGPLVNEHHGCLVLSTNAGAFEELGPHALQINPFDVSQTAQALAQALDMSDPERRGRAEALRRVAAARSPLDWFDAQLANAATPA